MAIRCVRFVGAREKNGDELGLYLTLCSGRIGKIVMTGVMFFVLSILESVAVISLVWSGCSYCFFGFIFYGGHASVWQVYLLLGVLSFRLVLLYLAPHFDIALSTRARITQNLLASIGVYLGCLKL